MENKLTSAFKNQAMPSLSEGSVKAQLTNLAEVYLFKSVVAPLSVNLYCKSLIKQTILSLKY